jgi:hypothetical protein
MKTAKLCFSVRLNKDEETQTTPPIKVEVIRPEAFTVKGINVYQEFDKGEWVLVKQIDVTT